MRQLSRQARAGWMVVVVNLDKPLKQGEVVLANVGKTVAKRFAQGFNREEASSTPQIQAVVCRNSPLSGAGVVPKSGQKR